MGAVSPNGKWIAYRSAEFGAGELYVSDLSPQGARGPGKWQISTGDGWQPRWRLDGKELFYTARSTLMAVAVNPEAASFEAAAPRPLFEVPSRPDSDRFAVTGTASGSSSTSWLTSPEPVRVLVNRLP
jgi:hypothetical protein